MPAIRDVVGYCPMGCGPHLHVMSGGLIMCLAPGCPDPGAVTGIISDAEMEHVVVYRGGTYIVRHPLRERIGDALVECDLAAAVFSLSRHPDGNGKYRATLNSDGHLAMDLIPE